MLGKENTKEQVTDNQMDYVANESATVDYEDRLSEDISNDTWHSALDDAASDEVMEKATFFVKTFVKKFEKKVREYSEEAEPSSNIRKPGKLTTEADFAIKSSVGPGVHLPSFDPISLGGQVLYTGSKKVVDSYLEERHREKAKGISKR